MLRIEEFLNMISVHELRRLAKGMGAKATTINNKDDNILYISKKIKSSSFEGIVENVLPSERGIFEKYQPFLMLYGSTFTNEEKPCYEILAKNVINELNRNKIRK